MFLLSLKSYEASFNQVPKSYVDWLEDAGARVIPIPYNLPIASLKERLNLVNGVVIPGGIDSLGMDTRFSPGSRQQITAQSSGITNQGYHTTTPQLQKELFQYATLHDLKWGLFG